MKKEDMIILAGIILAYPVFVGWVKLMVWFGGVQ